MPDIRDVKPPIEIPLYVWLLILLAVCVLVAVIYFFIRRRKKTVLSPVPAAPRSPWEIAYGRLEELSRKHYPEAGMFDPFYSALSDIVRHYLEDRFSINAPEMTTEEFLDYIKKAPITSVTGADHICNPTGGLLRCSTALKDFLNGCDMVKFAKYRPDALDAQANFDLAKKLIEETKGGI